MDRYIYKLILNSLYGKFGASDTEIDSAFMDGEELANILKTNEIRMKSIHEINPNYSLVSYVKTPEPTLFEEHDDFLNILNSSDYSKRKGFSNVAISASPTATANARIHMHKLITKCEPFYTDTDSIHTTTKLSAEFVGDGLGELKLENKVLSAIYVLPKVYLIQAVMTNGEIKLIKKFKGVPKNIVTTDHYVDLYLGNPVQFKVER